MTRRDTAIQAGLVFGLIVGIVGGNFVLHRWMLGNATSREVDAGIASASLIPDDLDEFAPQSRSAAKSVDPAEHRERLRKLIAEKLPNASDDERDVWLEELSDVSLPTAEGILDLRGRVGVAPPNDDSPDQKPASPDPAVFNFSLGITR